MDQTVRDNPLLVLLRNRARGRQMGLWSCCSANEYVIRAALRRAKETDTLALVEATVNQVDQNGGYTGMTPSQFHAFAMRLAEEEHLPPEQVFCGGDHLGPLTWRTLPEQAAMEQASALIESYVLAGFTKIHLDTSMHLADDDPATRLSDETIARRGADLCAVSETAFAQYHKTHPDAPAPVYIIGSEVPIPGGAQKDEDIVAVTSSRDCLATLTTFQETFFRHGLEVAWNRVIGLVVQPGVEFADESVTVYDRTAARELNACLDKWPGLVFEGHSTDYQPRKMLREMVEDGIAILKVGPALTFALREGLFALENIEAELPCFPTPSRFRETLERAMVANDCHWIKYYHGTKEHKRYARAFSFSDRARYYLPEANVAAASARLMKNLGQGPIPQSLLSQYLPVQYRKVREGLLKNRAEDILIDHIGDWIDDYLYATMR